MRMEDNFNRNIFESFPDSVYKGEMPDAWTGTQRRHRFMAPVAVAAAVMAVLAAVLVRPEQAAAPDPESAVAESSIVYTVNNTLHGELVLPDSTRVVLNSGSSLRVAEDFGAVTRSVYLDGEGLFDVHKDSSRPFLIRTPQDILVTVTGTRFNVSCWSDAGKFDLTLLQGSVKVTTSAKEVIDVHPSEELVIDKDYHCCSSVDRPEDAVVWTDGVLRFEGTSMREALGMIERWYGVDIDVEDESIYRNSFTAEFRSESLDEVLQLLCITSRLEYSRDGERILLSRHDHD